MDTNETFLTQQRKRSTFETKYLERFGSQGDNRIGLPGLSPQLVDKQHQMEQSHQDLEDARTKFESWKINFQKKRKEIEEKQITLQEKKKNLDQFISHHNAELSRAKKREAEEIQLSKSIRKELESLTQEEADLEEKGNILKKELDELQPYADYLQSVVESRECQGFDNVDAILNRYHSLSQARVEHLELYQKLVKNLGNEESELQEQLELRKSYLIHSTMNLNSAIQKAQQTKKQNEYNRNSVIKDMQRIEDKTIEIAAIESSIRNIYTHAVQQSGENRKKASECTEMEMLQFIQERFIDLNEVVSDEHAIYISQKSPTGFSSIAYSSSSIPSSLKKDSKSKLLMSSTTLPK